MNDHITPIFNSNQYEFDQNLLLIRIIDFK